MNTKRLENIADHKSRLKLISLFGNNMVSDDIKTDIPEQLKRLHSSMKNLYISGYLDCMRNATISMTMDNE